MCTSGGIMFLVKLSYEYLSASENGIEHINAKFKTREDVRYFIKEIEQNKFVKIPGDKEWYMATNSIAGIHVEEIDEKEKK